MITSIEVCNTICSKTFSLFLDCVFLLCVSLINKGTCKPCPSAVMGPAQQDTVVCTVPEAVRGASTRDLSITVQASPVYMCLYLRLSLSVECCMCLSFRLLKRMSLESVLYFESFSLLSSVCVHKHIIANGGSFDPFSLSFWPFTISALNGLVSDHCIFPKVIESEIEREQQGRKD